MEVWGGGVCRREPWALLALSTIPSPPQMPVCSYFLKGICSNSNCPYSHVYVSRKAEVCTDFLKGYCPLGAKVRGAGGWQAAPTVASCAPRRLSWSSQLPRVTRVEGGCCKGS